MKQKLTILSLVITFLFSKELIAQCGRTSILQISTGINYQGGTHYLANQNDEYWSIEQGPIGSPNLGFNYGPSDFPRCAVSHGWSGSLNSLMTTIPSTVIGYSTGHVDGNYRQISANLCANPHSPYIFVRKFKVDLTGITQSVIGSLNLYFNVGPHGFIQEAEIVSPSGQVTVISPFEDCDPHLPPQQFNGQFGILEDGVYSIKFKTRQNFVSFIGSNDPSDQFFEVKGYIEAGNQQNAFIDNNHFGKNVPSSIIPLYCAPAYPPSNEFELNGNHCITAPNTTTTFSITPFNNGSGQNVYTIAGPGNPVITSNGSVGEFTVGVGTYTITATEAYGCTFDSVLTVYNTPTLSVSPTSICIPIGTTEQVELFPNPGLFSDYGWQVNSVPTLNILNPFIDLTSGFYTITAVDNISACTATATTQIGHNLILNTDAYPECIPPGGTTNLLAHTYGLNTLYSFDLGVNYAPSIPSWTYAQHTVNAPGIYTVMAKDDYGCTAISTITVKETPTPTITLAKSQPCASSSLNATITATAIGAGGPFEYMLNGGTPQLSNVFTVNAAGTYTVTVIGANGCASPSQASITLADCSHCTYLNYPGLITTIPPVTSAIWYVDESVSNISQGQFPSGTPIIIDGTFTIDDNFNIINRHDIYLTENAQIKMNTSGKTFYISRSTLQGCGLWDGIKGYNNTTYLTIENASTIKHMKGSGVAPNLSTFVAKNSFFEENKTSIHLVGNLTNTSAPLNCIIEGNIFKGVTNYALTYPLNRTGIYITRGANVTIGDLSDVSKGNTFQRLRVGIEIQNLDFGCGESHVQLYNNSFNEIHDPQPPYYSGVYQERDIVNGHKDGSAIYAWQNGSKFRGHLTVKSISGSSFGIINNCDRGIVASSYGLTAEDLTIQNTMIGINLGYDLRFNTKILNNKITNAHIGINCRVNLSGSYSNNTCIYPPVFPTTSLQIDNNNISTRNVGVLTNNTSSPNQYSSPIGINLSQHNNTEFWAPSYTFCYIKKNEINLNAISGIGIKNLNLNKRFLLEDNVVNFNSTNTASSNGFNIRDYFGYWVENSIGASLYGNNATGVNNQSFMLNTRSSTGIMMNQSPRCRLMCNKTKYTRFGFFAWGNNLTYPFHIMNNKFSANYLPWLFVDAGSALPASFGDISVATNEVGNDFLGNVNWLNPGGYKIARLSQVQTGHKIFTNSSLLQQAESVSIPAGAPYLVSNNNVVFNDKCPDPLFKQLVEEVIIENVGEINNIDLFRSTVIANENSDYIDYPEVGKWIDEYRLLEQLESDSVLRNSDSSLLNFYNEQVGENKHHILKADYAIEVMQEKQDYISLQTYEEAIATNDLISNGSDWEMNEKYVNDIHIKLRYYGIDSITQLDKDLIKAIAEQCPFVGGLSVYKARSLQGVWDLLAMYDDRLVCMNASNKNVDNSILNLDSVYSSQLNELVKGSANTRVIKDGEVLVYPNPTTDELNIKHTCLSEGDFILYNSLGQIVYKTTLPTGKSTIVRNLPNLPQGIYNYKCKFVGCADYIGKLSIIR